GLYFTCRLPLNRSSFADRRLYVLNDQKGQAKNPSFVGRSHFLLRGKPRAALQGPPPSKRRTSPVPHECTVIIEYFLPCHAAHCPGRWTCRHVPTAAAVLACRHRDGG